MARKLTYTDQIAKDICYRLSNGECLVAITKEKGMPSYRVVNKWLRRPDMEEFRKMYTKAKEDQADFFADEIQAIADSLPAQLDYLKEKVMQNERLNKNWVAAYDVLSRHVINAARVKIDVRKWSAGKQRPRKYSDRFIKIAEEFNNTEEYDFKKLNDQELNDFENLCNKARKDKGGEGETES